MVYPALISLMRTRRLSVVDWTDALINLNGLVRFVERRILVSARVPSHFHWPVTYLTRTHGTRQHTIQLSVFVYEISGYRRGVLQGCCAVHFALLPTFPGRRILPVFKIYSPETTLTIQINATAQSGRAKLSNTFLTGMYRLLVINVGLPKVFS